MRRMLAPVDELTGEAGIGVGEPDRVNRYADSSVVLVPVVRHTGRAAQLKVAEWAVHPKNHPGTAAARYGAMGWSWLEFDVGPQRRRQLMPQSSHVLGENIGETRAAVASALSADVWRPGRRLAETIDQCRHLGRCRVRSASPWSAAEEFGLIDMPQLAEITHASGSEAFTGAC